MVLMLYRSYRASGEQRKADMEILGKTKVDFAAERVERRMGK